MRKLQLIVNTQGITGGNSKAVEKGFAILEARKEGQPVCQISVDNFQGQGKTYEERNEHQVIIRFGDECYTFTPASLHEFLKKSFKKIK